MVVVALLACGTNVLDGDASAPPGPATGHEQEEAPPVPVLAATLTEPPGLGGVILDAAQAVHSGPVRVAPGLGQQLVNSCSVIEALPNPPDPQAGDCTRGDSREDGECGLNIEGKPVGNPDAPEEWDQRFSADPTGFDPRDFSIGGTCGWLDVDLSRRTVDGSSVRYPATAEGGAAGVVELTFDGNILAGVNLDSIAEAVSRQAAVARERDTAALVARLSARPTVEDYRKLNEQDHGQQYSSILDQAASTLESELAAIPSPIAVGDVRWERTPDGRPRASVAVKNTSGRVIVGVSLGVQLMKPDGQPVLGIMCDRSHIAATLDLTGAMLRPDGVVRVFQSPWRTLPERDWEPSTGVSAVVPLSVTFSEGARWVSWTTIRYAASPCE